MRIFEVGGYVRDSLIGRESKDIDYVIEAKSFKEMKDFVDRNSKKVFLEKAEFGTIRYLSNSGLPEDMSLPIKSRNEDGVLESIGTIEDDLFNRDFTMNAIARDRQSGELLDPLKGEEDIKNKTIRCVRSPELVFQSDPARIIRAIRFKLQLGFTFDSELDSYLYEKSNFKLLENLNTERLRQELSKCFEVSASEMISEIEKLGGAFKEVVFNKQRIGLTPKTIERTI